MVNEVITQWRKVVVPDVHLLWFSCTKMCVFSLVGVYAWPCLLTVCVYVCIVAQW